MSRSRFLDLASTAFLLVLGACGTGETTLTLLDSSTRHPVEGALIYAPGELIVFRSDVHGEVDLPPAWGRQGVTILGRTGPSFNRDRGRRFGRDRSRTKYRSYRLGSWRCSLPSPTTDHHQNQSRRQKLRQRKK